MSSSVNTFAPPAGWRAAPRAAGVVVTRPASWANSTTVATRTNWTTPTASTGHSVAATSAHSGRGRWVPRRVSRTATANVVAAATQPTA
ncbi:hypothetical protein [Mycolicibacterium sp. 050158]|uniref:hypothetical protein n=1 Tax=Mycolicibacterium sp. 050158 TaxID=3090602 RepID=UPI00299E4A3A|nr:hypothetical protein [Mycolicibacterium sp. 050158]MDX1889317.1 hypothetical protein [Mycolicibacterium sp. 050158]